MASRFKNSKEFFDFVKKIHNGLYVYDEDSYKSLNKKIVITCPVHGEYQQLAHDHMKGHGCRKCHSDKLKSWTDEQDQFLRENYKSGSFWCATQLNKSDCAIRGRAKKLNITNLHKKINPNIPTVFWNGILARIREDGFGLDFDSDYVWELYQKQKGRCALTGRPIKFVFEKTTKNTTASLDRIDSKADYTKNNVQLTHKIVNRCKLNCPEDVFFSICKDVYLLNKERFEERELEWEMDIWNDREVPVFRIKDIDYENLNFVNFKRDKP